VPSSCEGAAATGGGAASVGGIKKNGNSGSGAAAEEVENAAVPSASAPKAAAARRVFILNELNICRPLILRPARQSPARRWGNQYRSTVSGRLHNVAKMVSSV